MRLFLSCFLPSSITEYVKELAGLLPAAKLVVPHNIDLTIKFLGSTQDASVEDIKQRLSAITFARFAARLEGIGVFPSEELIRVVWAGVAPQEKFVELHEKADAALKGLFPEKKKFAPHITIARVKDIPDKTAFIAALKKITVEPRAFTVDKLILYQSQLSPKGAVHTPVLEIPAQ